MGDSYRSPKKIHVNVDIINQVYQILITIKFFYTIKHIYFHSRIFKSENIINLILLNYKTYVFSLSNIRE